MMRRYAAFVCSMDDRWQLECWIFFARGQAAANDYFALYQSLPQTSTASAPRAGRKRLLFLRFAKNPLLWRHAKNQLQMLESYLIRIMPPFQS
jgi:hypothetical protein